MARAPRYDASLRNGSYNLHWQWRNFSVLNQGLAELPGYAHQSLPQDKQGGVWRLCTSALEGGSDSLVVAAYTFSLHASHDHVAHIFSNNPARTSNIPLEGLVSQAEETANLISESGLYPLGRESSGRKLGYLLLGMFGGGVLGCGLAAGATLGISKLLDIQLSSQLNLFGGILGVIAGVYLHEWPGELREQNAAAYVINAMPAHPANLLHGPPAVRRIEAYLESCASQLALNPVSNKF